MHTPESPAPSDPRLGRRAVIAAGAAGIASWYVGEAPSHAARLRRVEARRSESLADAFGVVVHFHFQQSVYGREMAVVEKVRELGARHVRSRLVPGMEGVRRGFIALADSGCRVNGLCQTIGSDLRPTARELMKEVRDFYDGENGGVFSSFEGNNEPNNDGTPWVRATRRHTKALWEVAKSHRKTDGIPVIGPALADTWTLKNDYRRLGDLTRWTDWGSIHLSPRGITPSHLIDEHVRYARASFGGQTIVCTEGAYNNTRGDVRLNPVPEDVAGVYGPRHLLEYYIRGHRFFRYELLDDVDPSKSDWESNFGLVGVRSHDPSDWRDKPALRSMRNFLRLVGDRGHAFRPSPLTMSLQGGGSDLRKVLLQKRDGTHLLVLWRDVTIYDPVDRRYLPVSEDRVTVRLGHRARLRVFSPSKQTVAARDLGVAEVARLSLRGSVKVLEIRRR